MINSPFVAANMKRIGRKNTIMIGYALMSLATFLIASVSLIPGTGSRETVTITKPDGSRVDTF